MIAIDGLAIGAANGDLNAGAAKHDATHAGKMKTKGAAMNRLLAMALRRIVKVGSLSVHTANGTHDQFGDVSGVPATIRFADAAAEREFLRDPDLKLGELYMDKRLIVEDGSIYDVIHILVDNLARFRPPALFRAVERLRFATRRLRQRNFAKRARQNVAHHYDLDSRLYRLFLDHDMQYSCAYFADDEMSLEMAQRAKKRHICAKLAVEPGQRVLDIGCGWGGMGLYLAETAGAGQVHGITLSQEQIKIATQRASASPAGGKIQFSLSDYRDIDERFDRIVSIGMFEHVGIAFYDTYFAKCAGLMTDGGVMLLHSIGCSDEPGFVTPWLDKYIFPGGYIPSLSEIIPAIERAGLVVADVEILEMHYAETLRHWRQRFDAHRQEAAALYDERFCRMWEFYLAAAEVAFRCENLVVFQILLTKRAGVLPRTRTFMAERTAALAAREQAMEQDARAGPAPLAGQTIPDT